MVEVSKHIDKKLVSKAYFLGVVSLMDALFNVKREDILKELNIDFKIKEALLEYGGVLGEIYKFAIDIESFDVTSIEKFTDKYNINIKELENLTLEVIKNSNNLNNNIGE